MHTCGSNTRVKFQIEPRKIERGIAEKQYFSELLVLRMESCVWQFLSMGGQLGNETNIDLLLGSSTISPTNLALIGNDDFITNLVSKSLLFLSLTPISHRDSSRIINMSRFFILGYTFFFRTC